MNGGMLRLGAALLATAALGGCGGGDKKDTTTTSAAETTAPATTTAATTETTAPVATTETTPVQAGGSGNLTPIGSKLKMGETATIAYKDSSNGKRSTIEVTPESIEKGSVKEDFKNIDLDADQKTATPFYVKVKAKNVGKGNLNGTDPAGFLDGLDDRGQEQGEVIFFGDFARCPDAGSQKKLGPGDSYETCLTFMIPKGGSLVGMRWIVFDQKSGKSNIDWK